MRRRELIATEMEAVHLIWEKSEIGSCSHGRSGGGRREMDKTTPKGRHSEDAKRLFGGGERHEPHDPTSGPVDRMTKHPDPAVSQTGMVVTSARSRYGKSDVDLPHTGARLRPCPSKSQNAKLRKKASDQHRTTFRSFYQSSLFYMLPRTYVHNLFPMTTEAGWNPPKLYLSHGPSPRGPTPRNVAAMYGKY